MITVWHKGWCRSALLYQDHLVLDRRFRNALRYASEVRKYLWDLEQQTPNELCRTAGNSNLLKLLATLGLKSNSLWKCNRHHLVFRQNHNLLNSRANQAKGKFPPQNRSKLSSRTRRHVLLLTRILLCFKVYICLKNMGSLLTQKYPPKNKSFSNHKMPASNFQDKYPFPENRLKN